MIKEYTECKTSSPSLIRYDLKSLSYSKRAKSNHKTSFKLGFKIFLHLTHDLRLGPHHVSHQFISTWNNYPPFLLHCATFAGVGGGIYENTNLFLQEGGVCDK